MKISQTFFKTLREVPAEAVVVSHQLLLRAGMIRRLGNGLFSYLPLGLRTFRKVERIIREEMDAIGCLECKPPVVVPGELWQESKRWDTMGQGLLKMKNRLDQDLVVSPTAEEVFTALMRFELASYKDYPISLYQINTKYRDEIRPRYGLMRAREFTMKDAYSFHTTAECLDATYRAFGEAYEKIFRRCGLKIIRVRADSGAMGGSGSEEFMVESAIGDDTLILCPQCNYAANVEKAVCRCEPPSAEPAACESFVKVETPNVRTIEELTAFLKTSAKMFIKTLIYQVSGSPLLQSEFVAVCIRGDLEVNEAKLAACLKAAEISLADNADVERITGTVVGFAGPVGLKHVQILADESVMGMHNAVTGALEKDRHYIHVEPKRDFTPDFIFDVRTVQAGDICPHCGAAFYTKKGNELGHIFKLGTKYTESMNMTYLDESGSQQYPLMGCYGIGVDRAVASIIEEHHDEHGIIWPMSVAPYQVGIVPIQYDGAMKEAADTLHDALTARGIEVLLDDRSERPGVKFKDMDLIGLPIRIIISDKKLPEVELKIRTEKDPVMIALDEAAVYTANCVQQMLASS
ncbi:MAG: proline--tRNA ligase [Treponema sp.]